MYFVYMCITFNRILFDLHTVAKTLLNVYHICKHAMYVTILFCMKFKHLNEEVWYRTMYGYGSITSAHAPI